MSLPAFESQAREWILDTTAGLGFDRVDDPYDVAVFHDMEFEQEKRLLDQHRMWQRAKFEAGYAALDWPAEVGGAGLDSSFADAFIRLENEHCPLRPHELISVTMHLIAPTINLLGTAKQKEVFLPPMLCGDLLACQLFSEPDAGSDLANVSTRAVRDGDDWVVTGQKVWTSGAQFAGWGELVARTDPDQPKHAGLTAFLVPLDARGVTVRPIRQMSGGTSFNEVFLDEVRIPDRLRLGEIGKGWSVALTTLAFEREGGSDSSSIGGQFSQLVSTAENLGREHVPRVRELIARVYLRQKLAQVDTLLDRQSRAGGEAPTAGGSIRKVQWVDKLTAVSAAARAILGRDLIADTGAPGTFAWNAHVLGAPGYSIAGGTDQIQRNIIAERVLGLPPEPRADRGLTWREVRAAQSTA
ncbi:acyl-CoA dehydrogenase family protein [Rhodococcus wratislaviensis]|uniref:Putative acyl-CoA dehydrogenase n=1 Tax=Rhodococcus wratislaviensis NBRC 100605 TaxID=1219028 RepID=X0Q2X2_RHOWR|nr:acyl-CoA dehydrogenase family protein [Rhodococcus wratislaviensis]GAF44711.1 putative acyl-CoA dehydrogenase [Rhodococcus wratislaviensis NBRC 100605]